MGTGYASRIIMGFTAVSRMEVRRQSYWERVVGATRVRDVPWE